MQKTQLFKGFIVASLLSVSLSTTYAEPSKAVYVVDMEAVLEGSIIGKAARNNLEAEFKKSGAKLQQAKTDLDKARADVEKQAALLSPQALEDKREMLLKRERELSRQIQDQRDDLGRKNNVEIAKVMEKVDKVIKNLAEKEKLDFVVERDRRFVVYVDKEYDLTEKVIKALDEEKLKL